MLQFITPQSPDGRPRATRRCATESRFRVSHAHRGVLIRASGCRGGGVAFGRGAWQLPQATLARHFARDRALGLETRALAFRSAVGAACPRGRLPRRACALRPCARKSSAGDFRVVVVGHALRTPSFEFNALPAATQVANDDDDYFPDDDYEQFLRETQPVAGLPMRPSTRPCFFFASTIKRPQRICTRNLGET